MDFLHRIKELTIPMCWNICNSFSSLSHSTNVNRLFVRQVTMIHPYLLYDSVFCLPFPFHKLLYRPPVHTFTGRYFFICCRCSNYPEATSAAFMIVGGFWCSLVRNKGPLASAEKIVRLNTGYIPPAKGINAAAIKAACFKK